jgi:hypothetical protein
MATKDTIAMAGIPPTAATIIGDFIDAQQADDAELADLAANLTATGAELNMLDNVMNTVEWAVTAGAANVCILTGTVKDAAGATIASTHVLDVYISEAATGIGITADAYSTGASVTTGTQIVALTANKAWRLITSAGGVFAISITDTVKPADQYAVVINPKSGRPIISAASAALWG